MTLFVICCFVLIIFVLLQPGKADAAAVFGGGANSSAFGPRGTQTVLAKITIGAAIVFFLIAFLFSVPGLFTKKSLGEGVGGPTQTAPLETPALPEQTPPAATPPATSNPAATTESKPAEPAKTDNKKPDTKAGDNKNKK
jgi:preprotein translocase subunit SecG